MVFFALRLATVLLPSVALGLWSFSLWPVGLILLAMLSNFFPSFRQRLLRSLHHTESLCSSLLRGRQCRPLFFRHLIPGLFFSAGVALLVPGPLVRFLIVGLRRPVLFDEDGSVPLLSLALFFVQPDHRPSC